MNCFHFSLYLTVMQLADCDTNRRGAEWDGYCPQWRQQTGIMSSSIPSRSLKQKKKKKYYCESLKKMSCFLSYSPSPDPLYTTLKCKRLIFKGV